MKTSEYPPLRRRSALADEDNLPPRRDRLAQQPSNAHSAAHPSLDKPLKKKPLNTRNEPNMTKRNLHRVAQAIAERHGHSIGRDAMYWATERLQPTPESFDADGTLSLYGAFELLRLMGKNVSTSAHFAYSLLGHMTKAELNVMREAQGLPPV